MSALSTPVSAETAHILAGARSLRAPRDDRKFAWSWFCFSWAIEYSADLAGYGIAAAARARRLVEERSDHVADVEWSDCPYAGQYDEWRKWAALEELLTGYRKSKRLCVAKTGESNR